MEALGEERDGGEVDVGWEWGEEPSESDHGDENPFLRACVDGVGYNWSGRALGFWIVSQYCAFGISLFLCGAVGISYWLRCVFISGLHDRQCGCSESWSKWVSELLHLLNKVTELARLVTKCPALFECIH